MDYEFTLNEYDRPIAEFSMGFEALGKWFSEELGGDEQRVNDLLDIVDQLLQHRISERQLFGSESQLLINKQEVEVMPFGIEQDHQLPKDTQLYDDEHYAACGLQDFKQALLSWQEFVQQ